MWDAKIKSGPCGAGVGGNVPEMSAREPVVVQKKKQPSARWKRKYSERGTTTNTETAASG